MDPGQSEGDCCGAVQNARLAVFMDARKIRSTISRISVPRLPAKPLGIKVPAQKKVALIKPTLSTPGLTYAKPSGSQWDHFLLRVLIFSVPNITTHFFKGLH